VCIWVSPFELDALFFFYYLLTIYLSERFLFVLGFWGGFVGGVVFCLVCVVQFLGGGVVFWVWGWCGCWCLVLLGFVVFFFGFRPPSRSPNGSSQPFYVSSFGGLFSSLIVFLPPPSPPPPIAVRGKRLVI